MPDMPSGAHKPASWQPCTKDSPRCEFWTWGADALRPECCTAQLLELLFFTEDLLTRNGIFHWLDFGTLLGAVRDGDLIPWDWDVDLSILKADRERVVALQQQVADAGYVMDARQKRVIQICYSKINRQHVDLFPWREKAGVYKSYLNEPWTDFPPHYLERLAPVRLRGREFPAPTPVDAFLAQYRYGPDFMMPMRVGGSLFDRFATPERKQQFTDNLRLLNDVLATTPLVASYWLMGGVLLGWAREGDILAHDAADADFGFFRADHERFLAAVDPLLQAGFQPFKRYTNNAGMITLYSFLKDDARFDFFLHERTETRIRCYYYGRFKAVRSLGWIEIVSEVPTFSLAPIEFLGRTWQKPADHDRFLTAVYGNWHEPRPQFVALKDDLSIVKKILWVGSDKWER